MTEIDYLREIGVSSPDGLQRFDLLEGQLALIDPTKVLFARTREAWVRRMSPDPQVPAQPFRPAVVLEMVFGPGLVVYSLFNQSLPKGMKGMEGMEDGKRLVTEDHSRRISHQATGQEGGGENG